MKFATIMLAALGLAADSDEKAVTVAVEKLKTDRDRFESLLDAEKSAHTETKAALAAADKELTAQREAERKAKVDGLIADARREGKLKLAHDDQGNPVETKVEKAIKRLASTDIEAAKEYVADLPRIIPVVASADEKVDRPVMGAEGLSEVQRRTNAALGITDEMWKKHNPPPAAQ